MTSPGVLDTALTCKLSKFSDGQCSYLVGKSSIEGWRRFQGWPDLDIVVYPWRSKNWNRPNTNRASTCILSEQTTQAVVLCEGGRGLTGVVGVWLQTVDHVVVCFQQHEVLGSVSVPDEDVATVGAAHYEVVAPKTRLLNLERQNTKAGFHCLTAEAKRV